MACKAWKALFLLLHCYKALVLSVFQVCSLQGDSSVSTLLHVYKTSIQAE